MAGVAMKIQQLKREIANCKQGDLTIEAYYATINTLWDQLSSYQHITTCHCNGFQKQRLEEERLHQFLMGVNDVVFGDVRSALLSMDPLPSLDQAYSTLLRQEDDHNPILSLPKEIADGILMRLPPKPLFALKCVSRRFKSAVMDPVFAQSYMHRGGTDSLSYHSSSPSKFRGLLYPCIRACRPSNHSRANYMHKQILIRHTDCREDQNSRILASSNGLILYQRYTWDRIELRVQNPLTSSYSKGLPCIKLPARTLWTCGFATRAWVDEERAYTSYKVVFIARPASDVDSSIATIKIFSSYNDTGSWVEVGNNIRCPKVVFDNSYMGPDFCYEGILHWIDGDNRTIFTYDPYNNMARDRFGEIPLPAGGSSGKIMNLVHLGEEELVKCCEIVYCGSGDPNLLVWRLVDYDKGKWVQEHRCRVRISSPGCRQVIAPDPWNPGSGFCHVYANEDSLTVVDLQTGEEEAIHFSHSFWSHVPLEKLPLFPFVFCPWSSLLHNNT